VSAESAGREQRALVTVDNVTKAFRREDIDVQALRGASLTAAEGEFVALIGESGAGKSTLLNLIGGLEKADSGTIQVDGTEVTTLSDQELADYRRENIGYVFQSFHLLPALTVMENVMLPLAPLPLTKAEREERCLAAVEAARIAHRGSHLPSELSGGEQQRASIARALVNNPRLILADEPTGQLDATTGQQVIDLLRALVSERKCTVITASHDRTMAEMADRTVAMVNGEVIA